MSLYDDKTSDDLWYYDFINQQKKHSGGLPAFINTNIDDIDHN